MSRQEKTSRNKAIADRYNAGFSCPEIAKEFGLSLARVHQILQKCGASQPKNRAAQIEAAAERNKAIVGQYQAGSSRRKIAEAFGLSESQVSNVLRNFGVSNDEKELRDSRNKAIVGQYQAGSSVAKIANDFNLSDTQVYKIISDYGVSLRYKVPGRPRLVDISQESLLIASLREDGLSIKAISRITGLTVSKVGYHLAYGNSKVREQGWSPMVLTEDKCDEIRVEFESGCTKTELARRYCVSSFTINQILAK